MDFDLRRHPGFRNPPMRPPVPFPGAWETQGTQSWYYRARRNFNFRRPPHHWRSGPPMDPPDDSAAKYHLQHVEGSINVTVPSHQQHPYTETSFEGGAAHADGSETITGQPLAYRAQHAIEGGNQQPSGDVLSRDEELLKTDQKDTEDEQAQIAASVDGDGPELLGISILNALEEVAGGGGEWAVGVQGSMSDRGDEHGEEHEAERDMHPTSYVANPSSTQIEQTYGEEFLHTEAAVSESVEEEEGLEGVGLVMSPEWAEHLRNSPSVQRYLQRVASKQAPTGKDTCGAEGKQRAEGDASRSEKQSGGAGNGNTGASRKKGKAKKKAGGKNGKTVQKASEDEVSSAEKGMELQLAKIKAHALLYAHQQQHRQLEDIIEES